MSIVHQRSLSVSIYLTNYPDGLIKFLQDQLIILNKLFFMKKIITLFIAVLFSMQLVSAQKIDTSIYHSPQDLHNFYWQKHKTNRIIGQSCLGAGIIMITVGTVTIANHIQIFGPGPGGHKNTQGQFLFFLGTATALASIPFFISSGKNKRKAMLAIKSENVSFGNKILSRYNYRAISLTVAL